MVSQRRCDFDYHLCIMRQAIGTTCLLLLMLSVCQRIHLYTPYTFPCTLAQTQLLRKSVEKAPDRKTEMWYNPNNSSVTSHSSYHNLTTRFILLLNPSYFLRLLILAGLRSGCTQSGRFFSDIMSDTREIPSLQQVLKMRLLISLCK